MKYLATLLFCLSVIVLQAQKISGKVMNKETGEPLVAVNILEKGTTNGTTTNAEGQFELNLIQQEAILIFSYIGFGTQVIPLKVGQSMISVGLEEELILDEVVITALGLKRSSKALGYAVQQLSSDDIQEIKAVNFLDILSGKLSGVTISQGASGVGSSSKITIRGESSFTNNNPLFVIDGIPINNNTILNVTNEAAAGFQEVDFGNGAMEVSPDDVASISVLKGPSAAALYGTRASNGVIIINTKDGSKAEGLGISFNTTTYVESAFQLPAFQNKYGQGNSGQFEFVDGLGGGINDNITYSYGPPLDIGNLIAQYDSPVILPNGQIVRGADVAVHGGAAITPTPFVSNPNNLKNFYKTGTTYINNLAFSGKYDKGHYRLSLTDLNSESIIPGVNLERRTAAARLAFQPTDKLQISSAINYVNTQSDNRPSSGYGSENINYSLVAWLGRQTNLNPLRDYWQPGLENLQQYSFNYTFFDNPYFILLENRNAFNRDRVFGNITASYDFNEHLSLRIRSGMDYSNELRQFRRAFSSNRFRNGGYAEHKVSFREINTDLLLNYRNGWGDFSFDISIGGNRMDQQASTSQLQALSLAQAGVFKLSNAAEPLEIFEFEADKRINSVYGLAKLGFRDFLFLDITGRNDWSSALATPRSVANTSFFYPSASLSFVLSNIVNLPSAISFAKLRASWAQVGNDTDPYQTTGVFLASTPFGGNPTFTDQNFIANANLLPEQTTSVELGLDLRFFDDRLNFDITYYNALTENQILSLPIALSSGYDQQIRNGGAVRVQGVEVLLGSTPIRNAKFQWNSMVNFSRNVATVEELPNEVDRLTLAYTRIYDNVNQTVWYQVREGDRIGDMWGTGYLKNEDGQFIIDHDGRLIVDNNLTKLGNYNPDFIIGFVNRFQYNNFNLSFVIDWRQGGVLVSRTQALAGVAGQLEETAFRPDEGLIFPGVLNVGSDENPQYEENTQAIPAETYYRQFYDRNHEENNTYNASYVKLREFRFGYSFPKSQLQGSFLELFDRLDISLLGRNLFAISDIPHFDPEQLAVQGSTFVSGVEDMSYASTRSFGISLALGF